MGMNMHINRFNHNSPLETPAPVRSPVRHGGRPSLLSGSVTSATELVPTDAVNAQAGVREGVHVKRHTLLQRMAAPPRPLPSAARSPLQKRARLRSDDPDQRDDDLPSLTPVEDALNLLREDSGRERQQEVESMLKKYFKAPQRYQILHDALLQLDQQPVSVSHKLALKRALNEMMSTLMERHPHEMRRALQESDELVSSLEALAGADGEAVRLPSTRELRFLIGAQAKGTFDAPLTPLTMLKALIRNFGSDKCIQVMTSLRLRMMSGL